ncbi:ROK family transcriptional regulator [Paenibacillus sp. LjRoot56]|uniref:ROK family transcriptional regulator n=1 Tax=Paenibacillus sp. LjRoot56 TaxID=3342333 RepID=UPI003ECC929A
MLTAKHGLMRDINKLTVLTLIRRAGSISRAEIAEKTGLNKTTVTSCVEELISSRLVREVGLAGKAHGRPPMMLQFNGKDGLVVGAALGIGGLDVIITNLEGEIHFQGRYDMRTDDANYFIKDIGDAIDKELQRIDLPPLGVVGIGVGCPGIVNTSTGEIVLSARYPNLSNISLRSALEERFQTRVTIEQNGNAALAGTYYFGKMKGSATSMYVHVGLGIGSGIMFQGTLYRGGLGFAPMLGHTVFKADGKASEIFEMHASEFGLAEHYYQRKLTDEEDGDLLKKANEIIQLAMAEDVKAKKSVLHTGELLGIGIASSINLLNPDHVIIGSRMNQVEGFMDTVKSSISNHAVPYMLKGVAIIPSPFPENSVAIGAASLAIEQIFNGVKMG